MINQVRDSNVRETTGFNVSGDLVLWPEEAWYLENRGLVKGDILDARSDVNAFYSHMRREGLFLTRHVSFKSLKEIVV